MILKNILEGGNIRKYQFYVVEALIGSKHAYINKDDGGTADIFLSPAMMSLLEDRNATIDDIFVLSEAIQLKEATRFEVAIWKKGTKPIKDIKQQAAIVIEPF
jgi:hypothetical protein